MRILLFLATNLAIILVASVTLSLLGIGSSLQANGIDLDLGNLLVICAVFGMVGSFVSLLMSKWMAKRTTGVQIIEHPSNADEKWLIGTVAELAQQAGIKMPEVGIFPSQQSNAFATGWNKNAALVAVSIGLLQRFSRDEVKAVMAHEIGHYVLNHQWKLITYLFLIFVACFAGTNIGFKAIAKRHGEDWGIRGIDDYAGLPLLYAVATVFMFIATPLMFRITYVHEYEADLFAINATQNPDAWAEVALMTAEYRKLHPPSWEENWLNHHPSPYVRIFTAMRWKAEQPEPTEIRDDRNEITD